MRRLQPIALLAGIAVLGLVTCDPGSQLLAAAFGLVPVRSFREISAAEARAWVYDRGAVLVRSEDAARRLGEDRAATRKAPVVVVTKDGPTGLRLAAELVRAGVPRVAVVRGGRDAWQETESAKAGALLPRDG